jgi:hypothetical protein
VTGGSGGGVPDGGLRPGDVPGGKARPYAVRLRELRQKSSAGGASEAAGRPGGAVMGWPAGGSPCGGRSVVENRGRGAGLSPEGVAPRQAGLLDGQAPVGGPHSLQIDA